MVSKISFKTISAHIAWESLFQKPFLDVIASEEIVILSNFINKAQGDKKQVIYK